MPEKTLLVVEGPAYYSYSLLICRKHFFAAKDQLVSLGVFPQGLSLLPHIFYRYQRQDRVSKHICVGAGHVGQLRETFRSLFTGTNDYL